MSGKLSSQPSELETLLTTNHVGQVWKASGVTECVAIQHPCSVSVSSNSVHKFLKVNKLALLVLLLQLFSRVF